MRWKSILGSMLIVGCTLGVDAVATPSKYVPESVHTFVYFSYEHLGLSRQQSRFDRTKGSITYDAAAKLAAVDLVIDVRSVDTGSAAFNKEIQSAGMLDTKHFPTATFKSTRISFQGNAPSTIEGQLTLNGITKPVTLTITAFNQGFSYDKKQAIGANATATIKRSDFNAGEYVPMVSDELNLSVEIEADRS